MVSLGSRQYVEDVACSECGTVWRKFIERSAWREKYQVSCGSGRGANMVAAMITDCGPYVENQTFTGQSIRAESLLRWGAMMRESLATFVTRN